MMNQRKMLWWGGLVSAALLIGVACALPGLKAPAPFASPTPNLTMTAFFSPQLGVPPTATPGLPVASSPAVPVPTATAPPAASPSPAPPTAAPVPPSPTAPPQPTPLPSRPGPVVSAPLLWVAPARIDGNLDDWRTTTTYPIANVVYGAANYSGASDLSGTFRIGWDYRALYVAVQVVDDHLVQNEHGAAIYKGDDVEIQLDTNLYGDFYINAVNGDDYQIGLSPGSPPGTSPEAYLWYPPGKARALPEVDVGVKLTTDGYVLEAAIPWTIIGFKPYPGLKMGFAISISDDDDPTRAVQQTMLSNDPYRTLLPTSWGTLVFYDPGKK